MQHALRCVAGEFSFPGKEEDQEGDAARRRVAEDQLDKATNTILRSVVDTPGFGNDIDHKHAVRPITGASGNVDEQFRTKRGAKETEAAIDWSAGVCYRRTAFGD